jgi:hypothetical protein
MLFVIMFAAFGAVELRRRSSREAA